MGALAEALAESGGSKAISWADAEPGDSFEGTIITTDLRQARKYNSTELDTWDDGNPKMQALITCETEYVDDEVEDDDGTRTFYVKMWGQQKQALLAALRESGAEDFLPGGHFKATFVKEGPKKKGFFPAKVYEYEYTPPKTKLAKAVDPDDTDEDDETSIEDQIEGMIGLGWTDSKIRKALPEATAKMIAAVRKAAE